MLLVEAVLVQLRSLRPEMLDVLEGCHELLRRRQFGLGFHLPDEVARSGVLLFGWKLDTEHDNGLRWYQCDCMAWLLLDSCMSCGNVHIWCHQVRPTVVLACQGID